MLAGVLPARLGAVTLWQAVATPEFGVLLAVVVSVVERFRGKSLAIRAGSTHDCGEFLPLPRLLAMFGVLALGVGDGV